MTTRNRLAVAVIALAMLFMTVACDCLSEVYARQHPEVCDGQWAAATPRPTPALAPVQIR